MTATRPDARALPDDPVALKNLFLRRAQERDGAASAEQSTYKARPTTKTPKCKDVRDTGESETASAKPGRRQGAQARVKPKPYRVIRLTVEEAKAISENRLTMESIKALDEERDDGIPEIQTDTDAKPHEARGASGAEATGDDHANRNEPIREDPTDRGRRQNASGGRDSQRHRQEPERAHTLGPDKTAQQGPEGPEAPA